MTEPSDPAALAEANRILVEKVLAKLRRSLRKLSRDEAVAIANAALVEAAHSYDPSRPTPFTTYAYLFVRGAVLDAVKKEEQIASDSSRAARAASATLGKQGGSESAAIGEIEEQVLHRLDGVVDGRTRTMIERVVGNASRDASRGGEEAHVTSQLVDRIELVLDRAPEILPDNERQLVDLHYREGLDLKQVAERLGVSYATVRRWHADAMERLEEALRNADVTGVPGSLKAVR